MIYTTEQWEKDGTFKAEPFQEVTGEIYHYFMECLPPRGIRNRTNDIAEYNCVFCMSEPINHVDGLPVYHTFGKYQGKYYYLGLRN